MTSRFLLYWQNVNIGLHYYWRRPERFEQKSRPSSAGGASVGVNGFSHSVVVPTANLSITTFATNYIVLTMKPLLSWSHRDRSWRTNNQPARNVNRGRGITLRRKKCPTFNSWWNSFYFIFFWFVILSRSMWVNYSCPS